MRGKLRAKATPTRRADWDGAWKEALQQLLPEFLELLFPEMFALVDWSEQPVFLEQELRKVSRLVGRDKRSVDKLVRVRLLTGEHESLLIHVEFQNQKAPNLPRRLYRYNASIDVLFDEPVITLAVLGDKDSNWRPDEYRRGMAGFQAMMRFPVAKLIDYEARWTELEASENPFAVVVMAHLKALATDGEPDTRLQWKLRLAQGLYERAYPEEQVQRLLDFIYWLMVLDEPREARWVAAMHAIEEAKSMPTITPLQQRFLSEGRQEGRQDAILETLSLRFTEVPADVVDAVRRIDAVERLSEIHRAAIFAGTMDEFCAAL